VTIFIRRVVVVKNIPFGFSLRSFHHCPLHHHSPPRHRSPPLLIRVFS
jgi:hypothetical protein